MGGLDRPFFCPNPRSLEPRSRPSSSMHRRFLPRKEPDCPAIILFRYSDCETLTFSRTKDDDEHEDQS